MTTAFFSASTYNVRECIKYLFGARFNYKQLQLLMLQKRSSGRLCVKQQ